MEANYQLNLLYNVFIMRNLCISRVGVHPFKDASFYEGRLHKYELSNSLFLHELDFVSLQNVDISIKTKDDASIYMFVNLATTAISDLICANVSIGISAFASCMLYFKNCETISLNCKTGRSYNFLILRILPAHLDDDQKVFLDAMEKKKLFHMKLTSGKISIPNLELLETAKKIKALNKNQDGNTFIARGHANIMIGQKIKELLSRELNTQRTTLRECEIQQLQYITTDIKQHPHRQYTIKDLCKKSGLSVSKLQLGFKEMHNCTVAIFIRNVRLEKALEMLHDTDLNVSEIVYSVGLNSRSYFCRVFKRRFKCSPKAYQQQLKLL